MVRKFLAISLFAAVFCLNTAVHAQSPYGVCEEEVETLLTHGGEAFLISALSINEKMKTAIYKSRRGAIHLTYAQNAEERKVMPTAPVEQWNLHDLRSQQKLLRAGFRGWLVVANGLVTPDPPLPKYYEATKKSWVAHFMHEEIFDKTSSQSLSCTSHPIGPQLPSSIKRRQKFKP